jgi:formate-dependent nitrite reductase membrane component NrfD
VRNVCHAGRATAWKQALREGAVTGSLAGILSTAVLALAGARQNRSAAAPINAASHWIWGEESLREDRPTLRHTLLGYLTQHAASIFWAALYSRIYGHRPEAKQWPQALAGAATTCAIAGVVDYMVVPKRLTPGYEHRLSTSAMVAVYAALAAGFALGAAALRRR